MITLSKNQNKTKMKNLINAIDGLTIHEIVRFIATLERKEREQMAEIIQERYGDVGINESKIIMNSEYVEGYAGNGFCTVGDKDYEERFLKIYFKNEKITLTKFK